MVAYAPRGAKGGSKGGNLAALLKGRKLVSNQRYVGSVEEWHNGWGWISPLDEVGHPQIKRNKGLIYIHKSDVRPRVKVAVGTTLDFSLYSDARGLGAIDCCEVEAGVTEAAKAVTTTGEEEPLPEGWEKHWSSEHSEWFYWNKLSKETSWVKPTEENEPEDDDEPLPQGWQKVYDAENQEWYYWHKATKKATWERPTVVQAKNGTAAPAKQKASDGEAPVLGQQRIKGQVTEWQGFFGWIKPSQALSEDLKSLAERNQGKIYVNWRDVQPGLTLKAGMDVAFTLYADDNGLAASDVREPEGDEGDASSFGVQELSQKYFAEDTADKAEAAAAAKATEEAQDLEGPLLPGWEQYWSDEHNCFYYWHKATKQSAWERPCIPVFADDDEPSKVWEGEGTQEGASRKATPLTPLVSGPGSHLTPSIPGGGKTPTAPSRANKFYSRGDDEEESPAAPKKSWQRPGAPIPAWSAQPAKRARNW
mmetsp:Transcript_14202/g.25085  ORF Transcript_14202/g.25085 Transcript_14202/m.25085 type:complete len:478 (-) Transcript_14202:84-1517(-)